MALKGHMLHKKIDKVSFYQLIFAISLLVILVSIWRWHPYFLSIRHSEEMRNVIENFIKTQSSIKGSTDPETIATIATGEHLDYLLDVRCQTCSQVQVATSIEVTTIEVQYYSETYSRVFARIEFGWHWASPQTGELENRCYAQAYNIIYFFERKNQYDNWKASGGEDIDINIVDDTPNLHEKHCEKVGEITHRTYLIKLS